MIGVLVVPVVILAMVGMLLLLEARAASARSRYADIVLAEIDVNHLHTTILEQVARGRLPNEVSEAEVVDAIHASHGVHRFARRAIDGGRLRGVPGRGEPGVGAQASRALRGGRRRRRLPARSGVRRPPSGSRCQAGPPRPTLERRPAVADQGLRPDPDHRWYLPRAGGQGRRTGPPPPRRRTRARLGAPGKCTTVRFADLGIVRPHHRARSRRTGDVPERVGRAVVGLEGGRGRGSRHPRVPG